MKQFDGNREVPSLDDLGKQAMEKSDLGYGTPRAYQQARMLVDARVAHMEIDEENDRAYRSKQEQGLMQKRPNELSH